MKVSGITDIKMQERSPGGCLIFLDSLSACYLFKNKLSKEKEQAETLKSRAARRSVYPSLS